MSTYHKREKGQSKEVFKLIGGRHVRPSATGKPGDRLTIFRGDTLHITKKEADFFGDKFELVVASAPTSASVTIDEDEEKELEEERTSAKKVAATKKAAETKKAAAAKQAEEDDDDDEVDVSGATGQGDPRRDDFSSVRAFQLWEREGNPDLSKTQRTGHGGRTFSLKDVKSVL